MFPQDPDMLKKTQGVGPIRKVTLAKDDHEGLGISITVRSRSCVTMATMETIQELVLPGSEFQQNLLKVQVSDQDQSVMS